jgi:hypothetical protein
LEEAEVLYRDVVPAVGEHLGGEPDDPAGLRLVVRERRGRWLIGKI